MSSFILDPARFSVQQRAWWNGFVCGLVGMRPEMTLRGDQAASGIEIGALSAAVENQLEDYPWHNPALPIVDRMALASGQPLEQKLMAAMAQLDCGSCGYLCHTYSKAIACGEETNLTLCRPGGRETKMWLAGEDEQQQYEKGLAIHSRTRLVYRLTEPYRRLTAVIGIDSRLQGRGNLVLVIEGDNKELFRRVISGKDPPLPLDLDIQGVRRLGIFVDFGESLDVADHLNLCNARIIK